MLFCSRRHPSTMKCRGNDVQLESAAVVEVQMKLRSHWQLLCKFKRQFIRQVHVQLEAHDGSSCVRAAQGTTWPSRGQGELHRRVYRAQRRAQVRPKRRPRAPKSAPRGVQRLQEAAKSLQEAPKSTQVGSKRRPEAPRGGQEAPSWVRKAPQSAPRGSEEAPSWVHKAPKRLQELPKTLQEAPKRLQVGLQRRPREVQERQNRSPSAIRQQTAPPCKNHGFPKEN